MGLHSNLLEGKVCLVTGASRGIGYAIAKEFLMQGAVVYAAVRTERALTEISQQFEEYKEYFVPVCLDVTNAAAAKQVFMRIKKDRGCLDVLVNNAGVMKDALIGMVTRKDIQETFEVNVFAVMELLQLAAKFMQRQKSGSIINMASIVGTNGNRGQLVYSASKGAVIALTKTAAKELAPYHVRVNAVAPGVIDTDMFHSIGEEKMQEKCNSIGMGRTGTPQEAAYACVYLASDLSAYVTGQILGVDGAEVI